MSRRLAILVSSALAAFGLGTAASAQQCPDPCTATFVKTNEQGMLLAGDTVLVQPTTHVNGTGALLGVIGGGTVCHPCTICGQRFNVSWNILSTKDLVYNNCGPLEQNGGSGLIHYYYTGSCGQTPVNLQLDYGDITGSCPDIPNPDYTVTWTFTCASCQ